jgi:ActR/RegA family two-component response regulator
MALGAAEYLIKPVDRREVLGALARCVPPPAEEAADRQVTP